MSALRGKICRRQIIFFRQKRKASAVSASAVGADSCSALPFERKSGRTHTFKIEVQF